MSTVVDGVPVTVADLVGALRVQQGHVSAPPAPAAGARHQLIEPTCSLLVVGAHPGAGATAVSVAVAEALADLEPDPAADRMRLVDAAPHESSGMGAAIQSATASRLEGWRAGRRGSTTILRPEVSPTAPGDVPDIASMREGWLVVDAGWPWREVMADRGQLHTFAERGQTVVVCRASVPGVRQVELALASLPGEPLVAAVGARRWPPAARASFGPRLAQAVEQDRAVFFPADRRVEVNGVDAEPFPRAVADAAGRLVGLVWPEAVVSPSRARREVASDDR